MKKLEVHHNFSLATDLLAWWMVMGSFYLVFHKTPVINMLDRIIAAVAR